MGLFKRAAVFTDIHWGHHGDSEEHNRDCEHFVEWFILKAAEEKCDCIIFLGDWFHNKYRIEASTIQASERGMRALSDSGLPVYWIVGNHDIYLKHSREISSLPYAKKYPNIIFINSILERDEVLFCPWLVGDEFAIPPATACKYVFGHFQLPTFLTNQTYEYPDEGGLHADHFYECEAVFSGHFHKRQMKLNSNRIPIWYIGNAFPHDFNDANDHERGMMILEWDQEPRFLTWPDQPTYQKMKVSTLLEWIEREKAISPRSTIQCLNDLDLSDEDFNEIRSIMPLRNLHVKEPERENLVEQETNIDEDAGNFEEIVAEHLLRIDSGGRFQNAKLIELWKAAGGK